MSLTIRPEPFESPAALALIEAVQQEYVLRYGGPDESPVDPGEFTPPVGLFLLARAAGTPVGCGGWRRRGDVVAEIKRMYVVPSARGTGVGRAVLTELERTATAAGFRRLELETGLALPEAVGLYLAAGYRPTAAFGFYAGEPSSRYLGKDLSVPHRPVSC
ncbi:GNAT family N-acetyltransferase [soil metagenome]